MNEQLAVLDKKDPAKAVGLRAAQMLAAGETNEYEKFIEQSIASDEKEAPDSAADTAAQAARNLAALGKCETAEKFADRALKLDQSQQILIDSTLTRAVCDSDSKSDSGIDELKNRFPKSTVVNSLWLPIIRAAREMNSAPDRALETLEINRQFEGATNFWDNYLRGKIYLKLGQKDAARAEFQKIADNRGWAVASPLYGLAVRELATADK